MVRISPMSPINPTTPINLINPISPISPKKNQGLRAQRWGLPLKLRGGIFSVLGLGALGV